MNYVYKLLIAALLFSGFVSEAEAKIDITSMPFEMLKKDKAVTLKWIGTAGSCELRYRPTPSATHSPDDYTPLAPPKDGTGALTFTPQDHGMTGGAYYCIIKEVGRDNISQEFPLCIESTVAASKRAPARGSTIKTSAPVFQWDRVIGVPYYCVIVFDRPVKIDLDKEEITTKDGSPVTPIYQAITSDNSIAYGTPDPSGFFLNTSGEALMPGATYPWLVLNCYASNPAFISLAAVELPWEFTYSQPTKLPEVILVAPKNSKTTEITERYLTFEWHTLCKTTDCDLVANYHIYLYRVEEEDGNEIAILSWDVSTSNTFYDINAENLLTKSLYAWKVVAEDKQGKGAVSKTSYFRYSKPQVVSLGTLNIQARYDTQEAVPLANVDIQDENQRSINPYPLTTGSSGNLEIDLNPGTYWVVVSKSGFETDSGSQTVESNTTKILTINLTKSKAYMRGRVLDGKGNGLSGALVKINRKESPVEEKKTFTAGDGSYLFSVEMGTSWELSVSKVGYDLSGMVVRVEEENTIVNDINIAKNENIIQGTVVNEDGYLIQNALVKVKKDVEWPSSTSDDGSFMFRVANGTWTLSVSKDGFVSPAPVTIKEATGGQLITKQLILTSRAGRVVGEVSSKKGPVPNATVEAYTLGGIKKGEAKTDNNGQYSLTLPWGMLNLRAKKDGYTSSASQQISLKAEETRSGVNFTLTANESYIKGKVTTDGTTPLSGAKVTNGSVVTTTNDSGSYDLVVSGGSFSINASREGCLSSGARQVTIGPGKTIEGVDFVLSPNASVIKGRVSSKEGPVYGAFVIVSASSQGEPVQTTTTDENGQYVFSLAGGEWFIQATKEGFTKSEQLKVSLASAQTARDQNLVIKENIGYVKGKVTADSPSACRNVNLRIEQEGEEVLSGVTDSKGEYFFTLTPGDYEIFASRTGYDVEPASDTFTVSLSDTPTVNFALRRYTYTIRGTVLGPNEEAIKNAVITVDGVEKKTDMNGRYELGVGKPDTYTVKVEKVGYKSKSEIALIKEGSTEPVILDFELEPNYARLEGTVTSKAGDSLGGVQINANGSLVTTLADGSYSYSDLLPGNYTITATKEGYEQKSETLYLEEGETTSCNFELISAAHSVRGTVKDDKGEGIPGASISIEKGSVKKTGVTDTNGEYLIRNLANDEYTISVVKKGYAILTAPDTFTVDNADIQVDFTLEALDKVIKVEVKDEKGNVVSDAEVVADGEADAAAYHGTGIYQAGNYVIEELKAGEYTVTATKGGYLKASEKEVFTSTTDLSLQITKIVGSIQGAVIDEKDSNPIDSARVTIRGSETDTFTYTNTSGVYLFEDLVPGVYTLEVEKEYYISRPRQLPEEVKVTKLEIRADTFILTYSLIDSLILGAKEKFISGSGESYQLSFSVQDKKGQNITIYPDPSWSLSPSEIAGNVTDGKYTPDTGYFGEVAIKAEIANVEAKEKFKVFHKFKSGRAVILKDNENLELAIPVKAEKDPSITEDELSIEKSDASSVRAAIGEQRVVGKIFNLLPDGFRFTGKDVVLRLPIPSGVDGNLSIGRWDKNNLRWEDLGGRVDGDQIEVAIDHFSEYVLLSKAKELGMEGLKIQPNPFSPKKKPVTFSYSLDTKSASRIVVTIKVYTITGDFIKTLNDSRQSVGPNEVVWDGTDDDDKECLNGRYLVQFILDDGKDKKEIIKGVVLIK